MLASAAFLPVAVRELSSSVKLTAADAAFAPLTVKLGVALMAPAPLDDFSPVAVTDAVAEISAALEALFSPDAENDVVELIAAVPE